MIINEIKGGIGNQIRQYIMGRIVAYYTNQELFLETSWFNTQRDILIYNLDKFRIVSQNIINIDIQQLNHFTIYDDNNIISLAEIKDNNIYLNGYWGDPKYRILYNEIIGNKDEFNLIETWNEQDRSVIQEMQSYNSIMVHIRRGDYITKYSHIFYNIPLSEYYDKIKNIQKHYGNLKIFIFSDDIQWVKENFQFDLPIRFINHNNGLKDYKDIVLMSFCKFFILANSSFSETASWLSNTIDKVIIHPSKIYTEKEAQGGNYDF